MIIWIVRLFFDTLMSRSYGYRGTACYRPGVVAYMSQKSLVLSTVVYAAALCGRHVID